MAVDKFVDSALLNSNLTLVADAIRSKAGTVGQLSFPNGFADAIASISGGGGGSGNELGLLQGTLTSYTNSQCQTLKHYAFYSDQLLTSINLPNCTTVGSNAFAYCNSLTSVSLDNCTLISSSAFMSCSLLSSISFPACQRLENSAFCYCSSLSYVSLPECTYFGTSAFYSCSALSTLVADNCTSIMANCFAYCTSLKSISMSKCIAIGGSAFRKCDALFYADFSACTRIADYAFYSCNILKTLNIPACVTLAGYCFGCCSHLETVNLPLCTSIPNFAFYNCNGLTYGNFPECLSIYASAFSGCNNLGSVSIPKCTSIMAAAFSGCIKLSQIVAPNCTWIASNAFRSCKILSMASLPKCTIISSYAFMSCVSLSTLYVGIEASTVCTLSPSSVFYNTSITSSTGTIYVPNSKFREYRADSKWSTYCDIIKAVESPLPSVIPTIVSWSTGTDSEIANMVAAADAGLINLSDYWSIGDTRDVYLTSMSMWVAYSHYYMEGHVSQTVQMTIMDFDCTGFSVYGRKPNAIVGMKDCMYQSGYMKGGPFIDGGWASTARRAWCNWAFMDALPENFYSIFKPFTWKLCYEPSDPTLVEFSDFFAIPPEYCIMGSTVNAHSEEASLYTQWAYYSNSENWIKHFGYIPSMNSKCNYWFASPASGSISYYCALTLNGSASKYGISNSYIGISPFGCV